MPDCVMAPRRPRAAAWLLAPALALLLLLISAATATSSAQSPMGGAPGPDRNAPVYYQADRVEYDRERGVVTLTGGVEFWQGQRMLLADKVTYNRNTNVAAAIGNVVLLESDGQTVFAEYAELSGGLQDGVIAGLRALLTEGGKLAANGARRTEGRVSELSRAVYSTCDLCPTDRTRAPLWQLRARTAIQDKDNQRIEYHDAVLDLFGIPVAYTPFLTHPDPTAKRASGILVPSFGYSKHLGAFFALPYYWVIDQSSDATITPLVASGNGPAVNVEYRHRFNSGTVTIDTSLANQRGVAAGHMFARGMFAIDDTWRWGFDINRASSLSYMRDFRVQNWQPVLTSQVFLEGFGQGAYSRLEGRLFQGLTNSVIARRLPIVMPYYQYSYFGERDRLGGRLGLDFDAFNLMRTEGTTTRRARLSATWNRRSVGWMGSLWHLTGRVDAAAYSANQFDQLPNFGGRRQVNPTQAMPTLALHWRWPLMRDAGDWGTQVLEPIAQVAVSPRGMSYRRGDTLIPNEDSLDLEFTDANLFALNRFPGVDRLEGGVRAAVALRGAWNFPAGGRLEGMVGQSYRLQQDTAFTRDSGLRDTVSDIVSHVTVAPTSWLDVTSRQRFDRRTMNIRFADALASAGTDRLRVTGGYIYTTTNPFFLYDSPFAANLPTKPRNEATLGVSTRWNSWRFSAFARRDLQTAKGVSDGFRVTYDDECFVFDVSLSRRHTSVNSDGGATTLLFQVTFKTVGQIGFNAL